MTATPSYHEGALEGWADEYSHLLRPDGSRLATLTEPEDRQWYRDLAPVVAELNRLLDAHDALLRENARLLKQLTDLASGNRIYYLTEERAFAPGIADGWPDVIPAPHTKNGRLVKRTVQVVAAQ